MNEFSRTWNSRHVRQLASAPGGKPDILFAMPDRIGFTNQDSFVDESDITVAEQVIGIKHCPVWKNEDMYELLDCYCQIHSLKKPTCAEEGIDMYVKLLSMLQIDGFEV